ncbi:hypothetical protein CCP3SC15_1280009 [Gammaproteobacteria bacterium]
MLRPTESYGLAMQQMGRALRIYPGKERAVILDHAGNTLRHGLPTQEGEWSLAGARRGKGSQAAMEAPVKQCPECGALVAISALRCPECDYEFFEAAKSFSAAHGELEKIDAVAVARERRKEQARANTFEELVALGAKRGYKHPAGWARHMLQARQSGRFGEAGAA